jgi:hypothetical protein
VALNMLRTWSLSHRVEAELKAHKVGLLDITRGFWGNRVCECQVRRGHRGIFGSPLQRLRLGNKSFFRVMGTQILTLYAPPEWDIDDGRYTRCRKRKLSSSGTSSEKSTHIYSTHGIGSVRSAQRYRTAFRARAQARASHPLNQISARSHVHTVVDVKRVVFSDGLEMLLLLEIKINKAKKDAVTRSGSKAKANGIPRLIRTSER